MAVNTKTDITEYTPTHVLNQSFDRGLQILAVELLAYDSTTSSLKRVTSTALNAYGTNNIDEASATVVYICKEDADGAWYILKIDSSSNPNSFTYASVINNSTVTSYNDAYTNRASLTYGKYSQAF